MLTLSFSTYLHLVILYAVIFTGNYLIDAISSCFFLTPTQQEWNEKNETRGGQFAEYVFASLLYGGVYYLIYRYTIGNELSTLGLWVLLGVHLVVWLASLFIYRGEALKNQQEGEELKKHYANMKVR